MPSTEEIIRSLYNDPVKGSQLNRVLNHIPESKFGAQVYALKRYAVYPNVGKNLAYPTLGLVDEYAEVMNKYGRLEVSGGVEEYMDVLWYLNQFCFEVAMILDVPGWGLYDIEQGATDVLITPIDSQRMLDMILIEDEILLLVGHLCGIVKKVMRDGNQVLKEKENEALEVVTRLSRDIFASVRLDGDKFPSKLVDMLHEKLQSRMDRGVLHGDGDYR